MKPYTILFSLLLIASLSYAKSSTEGMSSLYFIENSGQINNQYGNPVSDVHFVLSAEGASIFLEPGRIKYQWMKELTQDDDEAFDPTSTDKKEALKHTSLAYQIIEMELVDANTNLTPIAEEKQAYYERHMLKTGNTVTAHTYHRVTYKNVYPNIDWVLYTINGSLKYDFVVHEGGNVNDIKIRYKGADDISLQENGSILVHTAMANITEQAPYTYDAVTHVPIPSKFKIQANEISFDVAATDRPLVIDPRLEWQDYLWGGIYNTHFPTAITADLYSNCYVSGWLRYQSYIANAGYSDTMNNIDTLSWSPYNYASFVRKKQIPVLHHNYGNMWSFFLPALVADIKVDKEGNLFAVGGIDSVAGFATSGAHQSTYGGGTGNGWAEYHEQDAFLAKFDDSGRMVWATYYGGSKNDHGFSLTLDGDDNIYIIGSTSSQNAMATAGAHQTSISSSGSYGFIAKFNKNGVRQWGTYYPSQPNKLATDDSGNVYIIGLTPLHAGIATTGAFQTTHTHAVNSSNHAYDGFLVKFNTNGVRQWGTYVGGNGMDATTDVTVDKAFNVFISGSTRSTNNIATTGAQQTSLNGISDGFLMKFTPNGQRVWGTYVGGNKTDDLKGITMGAGKIMASGSTTSDTGLATADAARDFYALATDDFLTTYDTGGSRLYSTYLGGRLLEEQNPFITQPYVPSPPHPICYSPTGRILFTSASQSELLDKFNFPAPPFYTAFSAHHIYYQYYVSLTDTMVYIKYPFQDTLLCGSTSSTFSLPYGTSIRFNNNNVFTAQLSDANGSFASPVTIGSRADTTGDTISCTLPTNLTTGTGYKVRIMSSSPVRISEPVAYSMSILGSNFAVAANNGPLCSGDSLSLMGSSTTTGITWSWTGPNSFSSSAKDTFITNTITTMSGDYILTATHTASNCSASDTTTVVINTLPAKPTTITNSPLCVGDTLILSATSTTTGVTYNWAGPNSFSSNNKNEIKPNIQLSDSGAYIVTVTNNGCTTSDTAIVIVGSIVTPSVSITVTPPLPVAQGTTLTFTATPTHGGSNPTYQWKNNGVAISGATGNTYISNQLNHLDTITVDMVSDQHCAMPQSASSNEIIVQSQLSIATIKGAGSINLSPNPNNGNFTLKGQVATHKALTLTIINSVGQIVHQQEVSTINGQLNEQVHTSNLASGVYLLQLQNNEHKQHIRFTVK